MNFLPKLRFSLILPFLLLAFLPVVIAVVVNLQNRQELRSRAFVAEDFWKTVRENGVLIGPGTSPATTDEGGLSKQGVVLPTVSGFGSDLFTGAATVAYGLSTPAGPGGLGPSISFNYSSNIVSDLRFGLDDKDRQKFYRQSSMIGWGWELGGLGTITRESRRDDNKDGLEDDVYYLSFAGGGFRLFRKGDSFWGLNEFETNPKSFLKIEHLARSFDDAADTDEWVVTGRDGTRYYFGSPIDENNHGFPIGLNEEGYLLPDGRPATLTRVETFTHCDGQGSCWSNQKLVPYKWLLRRLVDVHGNEMEVEYTVQERARSGGCVLPQNVSRYIRDARPGAIRWGKNSRAGDADFDYVLEFDYEDRPDSDWQIENFNDNCAQVLYSEKRLHQAELNSLGQTIRRWVLEYKQGDKRDDNDGKGHSLLIAIREFGSDPAKALPAQAYGYEGVFNETKLQSADNGYGGKVFYEYEDLGTITVRNANDQADTLSNRFNRLRVKSRRIEDGVGNFYTVTYEYFEPSAFAEQLASYPCATPFEPEPGESCDPNVYEFVPPLGFEFLGHKMVRTALSEIRPIGPIGPIGQITESEYYQTLAGEGCFRIDPRRGQAAASRTLGEDGRVWQEARSEFGVFGESGEVGQCNQIALPKDNASYQVRHKTSLAGLEIWRAGTSPATTDGRRAGTSPATTTDGSGARWTKSESLVYDEFGNLLKSVNYGEVDREGLDLDAADNRYNYYNFYNSSNPYFIGLARESFVANQDFAVERVPSEIKKNWTETAYDGRDFTHGVGERGLATAGRIHIAGASHDSPVHDSPVQRFEYDAFGNQTAAVDAKGNRSETSYEQRFHKLPKSVKNALGQEAVTTYDYEVAGMGTRGLPVTVVDANGTETKFSYDSFGRARVVAKHGERSRPVIIGGMDNNPDTIYTYFEPNGEFSFSNITASGQARFAVLTAKKIDKDEYVRSLNFYNGLGQLVQSQQLKVPVGPGDDLYDFVSSQIYDSLGRVVFSSRPFRMSPALVENGRESPFVSGAGPRPETASPDWPFMVSRSQYDMLGRAVENYNFRSFDWPPLLSGILPEDIIIIAATHVRTEYNGFRTTSFDPNFVSDPGQYAANRRVSVVDGLGRVRETREYVGSLSSLGSLRVPPLAGQEEEIITRYEYDVLGNLTKVVGSAGNETTVVYDSVGRREKLIDPDLGTVEFEYDENGNLIRQVQEAGTSLPAGKAGPATTAGVKEVNFVYDQLNRLVEKKYGEEKVAGYAYDSGCEKGVGRLCRAEFAGGSYGYDYDERGRMIREVREFAGARRDAPVQDASVQAERFTTGYSYLDNDSLREIVYPGDGEAVAHEYDKIGRLKRVFGQNEYVSRTVYDERGRLEVFESGNGVETAYSFEEETERVAGISHAKFGAEALARFSYEYDPAGNIVEWNDFPFPGRSFAYDSLHRLVSGAGGFEMEDRYQYDVLGRMGYKKEGTEELKMDYDDEQPLHGLASLNAAPGVRSEQGMMTQAPGINFQYDRSGNLLKDDRRQFSWNAENYPTEISLFGRSETVLEFVQGMNRIAWPSGLRPYSAKAFLEMAQGFCQDIYQIVRLGDGVSYIRSVGGTDFLLEPAETYALVKGLPGYCAVAPESNQEVRVSFAYDANNRRFHKAVNDGSNILYVNDYLEKTTTAAGAVEWTKYYFAFGKRVAVRTTSE